MAIAANSKKLKSLAIISMAFAVVTCLLAFAWILMIIANWMPNWSTIRNGSTGNFIRSGIWGYCSQVFGVGSCFENPPNVRDNGFTIAARFFCTTGNILTFFAMWTACYATVTMSKILDWVTICLCLFSWVFLFLGWGMWIGVHNELFKPAGFELGSSFIVAIIASVASLLAFIVALVGLAMGKKQKKKGIKEVPADFPPALDAEMRGVAEVDREEHKDKHADKDESLTTHGPVTLSHHSSWGAGQSTHPTPVHSPADFRHFGHHYPQPHADHYHSPHQGHAHHGLHHN